MGNVYTKDIKRIAIEIFEKYKDQVTTDFSKNKELVKNIVDVQSKKVRNRIAGYLTRYAKLTQAQVKTSEETPEGVET
jgi:small subunit ribosomal protein S17e